MDYHSCFFCDMPGNICCYSVGYTTATSKPLSKHLYLCFSHHDEITEYLCIHCNKELITLTIDDLNKLEKREFFCLKHPPKLEN